VALMAAGVVAGPSGLGLIKTPEEVDTLAEIGIVLLLFTVGLDFSLAAMRQIWKPIMISGTLQMIGTGALVAIVLVLAGVPARLAIFVGLFVALSSTAIVLKGLAEHNQVSAPHGRLMVGILLLQDLAIEEEQRAQRLVLRGRRDVALDGQGTQEPRDLGRAHLGGVTLVVKEDVAADPSDVGLLGAGAAVAGAQRRPHAIQQARRGRSRRLRHGARLPGPRPRARRGHGDTPAVASPHRRR